MAKLLSICIPTYNRAKFLERLLKQIVDETSGLEACVEIVVSDNCSDDNTAQVLRKFSSKANLRYARNKANFRYDVNVVKCLSLARGKFCWLMGDDDLFVGGQIRKMVSVLDGCDETVGGVLTDYFLGRKVPALKLRADGFKICQTPFNVDDFHVACYGPAFIGCAILRTSTCKEIIMNELETRGTLVLKKNLKQPDDSFNGFVQLYLALECISRSVAFAVYPKATVHIIGDGSFSVIDQSIDTYGGVIDLMSSFSSNYPSLYCYSACPFHYFKLRGIANFLITFDPSMPKEQQEKFYFYSKKLSDFYRLNNDNKRVLFDFVVWLHRNIPPVKHIIWAGYHFFVHILGRKTYFERQNELRCSGSVRKSEIL